MKLQNNEVIKNIGAGVYAFKASGALELQFQLADEGFDTVKGGLFAAADSDLIELPSCDLKMINGVGQTFIFNKVRGTQ